MKAQKLVGITMMYTNNQASMRHDAYQSAIKILDIPANSIVIHTGKVAGDTVVYREVEYGNKRGWVYEGFLDVYIENVDILKKDCVPSKIQTLSQIDAPQYALYNGAIQYNLCGWWCMAHIMGSSLEDVLETFERENFSWWTRIFGRKNGMKAAGGTNPIDLIKAFETLGQQAVDFGVEMKDKVLNRSRYTVDRFSDYIQENEVICSVNIDGQTGRLRGAGILHWIRPLEVYKERIGYGGLKYYNPFSNREELVELKTFFDSARQPYGVSVKV